MPHGRDTPAVPVFRRRVDEEQLGFHAGRNPRAKPVLAPGYRIDGRLVEEGELRLRERAKLVRLREALVEAAEADRAGLDERRVEHLATGLVEREPLVNHLPDQAPGLRGAIQVGQRASRRLVAAVAKR